MRSHQILLAIAWIALAFTACVEDIVVDDEADIELTAKTISGRLYYPYEVFREDRDGWKFRVDTIWVEGATVRVRNSEGESDENGLFQFEALTDFPVDITIDHPYYALVTIRLDSASQNLDFTMQPKTETWLKLEPGSYSLYHSSSYHRAQAGTHAVSTSGEYVFRVESVTEAGKETHVRMSESSTHTTKTEYFLVDPRIETEVIDYTGFATLVIDSLSRIIEIKDVEVSAPGQSSALSFVFNPRPNRTRISLEMPVFSNPSVTYRSPDGSFTTYTKNEGIFRVSERFGATFTKVLMVAD